MKKKSSKNVLGTANSSSRLSNLEDMKIKAAVKRPVSSNQRKSNLSKIKEEEMNRAESEL